MTYSRCLLIAAMFVSVCAADAFAQRRPGFPGGGSGRGFDWSRWSQQWEQRRKEQVQKRSKEESEKKLKERVSALMAEGWANLHAGEYIAARETFADVLELKPDENDAKLGIGLARAGNGEWVAAQKQFETAMRLESVRRLATYNLAVVFARMNQKPRAAVTLHNHLTANAKKIDEMALNAQRSLVFAQIDEAGKKGIGLLPNILKLVAEQDKLLATEKYKGQERYGIAWVPDGTASKLRQVGKTDPYVLDLPFVLPDGSLLRSKKPGATPMTINVLLPKEAEKLGHDAMASAGMKVPGTEVASAGTTTPGAPAAGEPGTGDPGAASPATPGAVATADPGVTPPGLNRPAAPRIERPVLSGPGQSEPAVVPAAPSPAEAPAGNAAIATVPDTTPAPAVTSKVTTRGAAFCVAPDTMVTLTRIVAGATTIKVAGETGEAFDAEVISVDDATGLALLKLAPGNRFKPLPLAEKIKAGPAHVACFQKTGLFGPELDILNGDLSAVAGKPPTLRVASHPRSSGSPVVDSQGNVLAVMTATRDDLVAVLPVVGVEAVRALINGKFTPSLAAINPDEAVAEITAIRTAN